MVATVLNAADTAENKTTIQLPCGLYCSGVDRQFLNKEHMVMEEMKGEDRDGIAAPAATCGGKDP